MKTAYQDSGNGSIHSNSAPVAKGGDAKIEDRTGLYLAILAFGVALLTLGMHLSHKADQNEIVDAKVAAAVAQAEARILAGVAKDVADAKAVAHTAETHGRLALANVDRIEVELNKQGIKVNLH